MASSVRHVNASISSASNVTPTGDFTDHVWVLCNTAGYSPAGDTALYAWGTTGGTSEGFIIGVGAGLTALFAGVFRNGAAEFPTQNILTGSSAVWVAVALRHTSGSASYDLSYRLENATTWTTVTLTLTTQIVLGGSQYLGTDQFAEPAADGLTRGHFTQAVRMNDATLLAASQISVTASPSGTNLHDLRLLNSATATTNGGTAGTWAGPSGTLQTASSEPTESLGGPTISVQPASTQVAIGVTASFSVTASASGGGALTYQWKLNGTNVSTGSGGTTASYTTGTLAPGDDLGSYTCAVTETGGSSDGTVTSAAAILHVGIWVVGANTATFSTSAGSTVAPSYSTLPSIAAGDEILLVVAQKPSTANGGTVTTPTGYTLLASLTAAGGYSTTLANNTGNTNLFIYRLTAGAAGTETGTFTVTVGTNGVCSATLLLLRPPSGATISYASATGSQSTAGNISITVGSDPGETTGDVAILTFNGSSALATYSAEGVTTTGVTYGAVTERAQPSTTVGNDVAGFIATSTVQSGTSSAAPVFTATTGGTNTNARGPGIFLRARAASAGPGVSPPRPLGPSPLPGWRRYPIHEYFDRPQFYPSALPAPPAPTPPSIGGSQFQNSLYQNYRGVPYYTSAQIQPSWLQSASGNTGTAAAAFSAFAAAAAGLVAFLSVGTAAASPFASSGACSETFSSTSSTAVSSVACSGAGAETFAGTCSSSASPFATTATGTESIAGSVSAAAQSFASAGAGSEAFTSAASAVAQSFAVSGVGTYGFACSGTAAMSPFAATASGFEAFSGTVGAAASSFACTASGAETFSGSSTSACSPFGASANGATGTVFSGSASAAVSPFASASAGSESFTGAVTAACSSFAPSGTGTESFSCTASAAGSPFGSSANGAIGTVFTSSASAVLSSPGVTGAGAETFAGTAAAAPAPFATSSAGAEAFTGTISAACSSFGAAGAGTEAFSCSGSAALAPFAATGNGATGTVFTSSATAAESSFGTSGSGIETFTGVATAAQSTFAATASGTQSFTATASASCSPFASAGNGAQGIVIVGTATAGATAFSGSGSASESFMGPATVSLQSFAADAAGLEIFAGAAAGACSSFAVTAVGVFSAPVSASGSAALASFGASAACSELFTVGGSSSCQPFGVHASQAPDFRRAPLLRNWPTPLLNRASRTWPKA